MTRFHPLSLVLSSAMLFLGCISLTHALPTGFIKTPVFSSLQLPTAVRFAKNGHVFVAEKDGLIKKFESVSDSTPVVVVDLNQQTYKMVDHGLLGFEVHPNFPDTPYVYVLYSAKKGANGAVLARLTIQNDAVTQQLNFSDNWCEQSVSHAVGDIQFGSDGALYVSHGDGASPDFADYGQTPDSQPPYDCNDPANQGGAFRSQDMHPQYNSDPLIFNGTMLRLDPVSGNAMANNPLLGGDSKDDKIIAYGLRNPFRFAQRPGSQELYIADVGWGAWEEINRISNATDNVIENFGWPCYEGAQIVTPYQALGSPICQSLYTATVPHAIPFHAYNHWDSPEGEQAGITAIGFYQGDSYPAQYKGALFFGDYTDHWIKVMWPGADGKPDPNNITLFDNTADNIVQLVQGTGGDMYYVDHNGGKVIRIMNASRYKVIATMNATPNGGIPGTQIQFDATGSQSTLGNNISYAWDLDGDGAFDDGNTLTPTFAYLAASNYIATLKVTDSQGNYNLAHRVIHINQQYPVPTITTPAPSLLWKTGDTIQYAGNALTGDGQPVATLQWAIDVFHCAVSDPSVCHTHTVTTATGNNGSFVAPDHDYPSHLDIRLTAKGNQYAYQWWNNSWAKRRWIFFNNIDINETLSQFPVLVRLDADRIDYSAAGVNGASLRFIASDGSTVLPHHIESWNPQGNSYVWVKVSSIPNQSHQHHMWMYYGNNAAASSEDTPAVWGDNFAAVWHFNDNANDATNPPNNGTLNTVTSITGLAGNGYQFNGTSGYVGVAHDGALALTSQFTMEAWVKLADATEDRNGRIISKRNGDTDATGYSLEYNPALNTITLRTGNTDTATANNVDLDTQWHHIAATVDGNTAAIYVDGMLVTTDNTTDSTASNTLALAIGRDGSGADYFRGSLDEVRLSNVARSAAWISAQNRAMSDTYLDFSSEEVPTALSSSTTISLWPQTSTLTVQTNPPGLQVVINGHTGASPLSRELIVNAQTAISTPPSQKLGAQNWGFDKWVDNYLQADRLLVIGANNQTHSATFKACNPTHPTMNVRGTFNNWGSNIMTLDAKACRWNATIQVAGNGPHKIKFDVNGDWVTNYGDNGNNGIADLFGTDITLPNVGFYNITFDDISKQYTATCVSNCVTTDIRRTVIFLKKQTVVGQDMFMRGGIDWGYAQANLGLNCSADKWLCAIPISHRQFITNPQRAYDKYLDWYGTETGQGNGIQGSPLVWTTNNISNPNKVDVVGYGYTPLNKWGDHYWMLDVNMDCAKTVSGWFELKAYVSNGPGWETNITQPGAPYATINHFAQCGKINKFEWAMNAVEISDFP